MLSKSTKTEVFMLFMLFFINRIKDIKNTFYVLTCGYR